VEYACSVRDLTRNFGGLRALAGISFDIKPGEVFGLIGPNGSGKTTTLRIVSTLLRPSSGKVSVFGIDVAEKPGDVRRLLSYLPEDAGAYKNLSGLDYLRFMATFYTQDNRDRDAMVEQGKELAGLGDRIRNRVKTYSNGDSRRADLGVGRVELDGYQESGAGVCAGGDDRAAFVAQHARGRVPVRPGSAHQAGRDNRNRRAGGTEAEARMQEFGGSFPQGREVE
jgi:ABC-type transport system involved in cytochrome c biogenesis ATPase subunit